MKKKSKTGKICFIAISIAVIFLIISLRIRIKEIENEKELLQKTIDDYRLTVEEMEYDLKLSKNEYIEKYAREILGYHKYSDIILKEASDE